MECQHLGLFILITYCIEKVFLLLFLFFNKLFGGSKTFNFLWEGDEFSNPGIWPLNVDKIVCASTVLSRGACLNQGALLYQGTMNSHHYGLPPLYKY